MTLLLQNQASKEFFIFSGLTNLANHTLYFDFDIDLSDLPKGEYEYMVVCMDADEYEMTTPLQESWLITGGERIMVQDLQPATGILKIGMDDTEDEPIYDSQTENNIFYYEN